MPRGCEPMPRIHEIFEWRFVEPGYVHPKGYEVVELAPGTTVDLAVWRIKGDVVNQPVIDLIAARMEGGIAAMVTHRYPTGHIEAAKGRMRTEKRTVLVKIRIPV